MLLVYCIILLVGFLILFWSADQFVYGAVATARNLNLAPMIIGLTVVALGTSAPEVFVSIASALRGAPELAVGNAIGSNLANIGLVLGITAVLVPLPFSVDVLRRDLPILILVTAAAGLVLADQYLGKIDALLLLAGLGLFLLRLLREQGRTYSLEVAAEISDIEEVPKMSTKKGILVLGYSLVLLIVSSEMLVRSATEIAVAMGLSHLVIGLTVIAIGTSLPELVVSVTSALKGQTDLAIGNIVGSNIFNLLLVLAVPGLIHPSELPDHVLWRDYLLMALMTVLLVLLAYGVRNKARITRVEGSFMLITWILYLVSLYHQSITSIIPA